MRKSYSNSPRSAVSVCRFSLVSFIVLFLLRIAVLFPHLFAKKKPITLHSTCFRFSLRIIFFNAKLSTHPIFLLIYTLTSFFLKKHVCIGREEPIRPCLSIRLPPDGLSFALCVCMCVCVCVCRTPALFVSVLCSPCLFLSLSPLFHSLHVSLSLSLSPVRRHFLGNWVTHT